MINLFKNTALVVGLLCLGLGIFTLIDAIAYKDTSIGSIVGVVGFSSVGVILLSTYKSLKTNLIS